MRALPLCTLYDVLHTPQSVTVTPEAIELHYLCGFLGSASHCPLSDYSEEGWECVLAQGKNKNMCSHVSGSGFDSQHHQKQQTKGRTLIFS